MKQEELEIGDDASGTIGALKPYSPLRIRSDYQPSVNIPPPKKKVVVLCRFCSWMDFPEARSQVKNFLAHVCHMEMYLQGPSR